MTRFLVLVLTAVLAAGAFAAAATATPFESRFLRASAADALPDTVARTLNHESEALNTLFLAWADDQALVFNGALALARHGDTAREVLTEYGFEPGFQDILARFGPDAVLPVAWFHDNEVPTLTARHWATQRYREARDVVTGWWNDKGAQDVTSSDVDEQRGLTPYQRGLYAVAFLQEEGYGFLYQFVVDEHNRVHWLQGERLVAGVGDFFTGGLRDLERTVQGPATVGPADIAWAGVDVVMMAGAIKWLRASRMARAGVLESRAAAGASGELRSSRALVPAGLRFTRLSRPAKLAAVGATAWVVVRHPDLINGLGANLAHWLGWPVKLGQFVLWFAIALPLLWLINLVWRWLIRPLLWVLLTASRGSRRLDTKV
ncbi:hypothetical protein GCM10010082_19000 [Kushneria pakistanensis]|uniref:DUF2167 domain-containing protein n=1 Tax=Kushneria pakistanensis TaxID=1508770 RepID=A0ABQ3FIS6_9GAMM|nr:hypothetical protein [Kushneria pakistanensis]GHC26115.1 hypothetical protein GCM10010082_19000 [Kushneria pakistanensis]